MLSVWKPKTYKNSFCETVNVTHFMNLRTPLCQIVLVDTNGIDPHSPYAVHFTKMAQRFFQIDLDKHFDTINEQCLSLSTDTPSIRESLIGRAGNESRSHQLATDRICLTV